MKEKIRKRMLPPGWYPDTSESILKTLKKWESETREVKKHEAVAAIVPHAGWFFSGNSAFKAVYNISKETDTVVIAGGHLGESDPVLAAREDKFDAVLGYIENDMELLNYLSEYHTLYADDYPDNTVEINLPIIKYLLPDAKILWLRVPPDYERIVKLARNLNEYSSANNRKISVIGSTDLTHYGYNYGFHPHGPGKAGLEWVKEKNDREFIELITEYQIKSAIEHSRDNRSSCSSGGASLASEYALINKCKKGALLDYHTSYDIAPSDSFVGYASVIFHP